MFLVPPLRIPHWGTVTCFHSMPTLRASTIKSCYSTEEDCTSNSSRGHSCRVKSLLTTCRKEIAVRITEKKTQGKTARKARQSGKGPGFWPAAERRRESGRRRRRSGALGSASLALKRGSATGDPTVTSINESKLGHF